MLLTRGKQGKQEGCCYSGWKGRRGGEEEDSGFSYLIDREAGGQAGGVNEKDGKGGRVRKERDTGQRVE